MEKYTNKNKFFADIIDDKLKNDNIIKDPKDSINNYLCDIDYVYRFNYGKCNIVSQLKQTGILGNKWFQYKNFVDWCKKNNKEVPDYIPETHLIHKNNIDEKLVKKLFENKKKWIVKPENASFRAGIHVVNNYNSLVEWIGKYVNNKWIIQDYIDNPLKIDNKKMHFRIYVLLIKTVKYTQVVIYNKGYIFLSAKEYNKELLDDDSNLSGGDSWDQMRLYPHKLIEQYGLKNYRKVLKQINEIVKTTMRATIDDLVCVNNKVKNFKCYKLLGYDILINEDFKLYLGEINSRTVNVKFPIKNMYENLIEIIKTPGPLSNKFLIENNLNYYSIINECNKIQKVIKGGNNSNNFYYFSNKYFILIIIMLILFLCFKNNLIKFFN
tara:strand:+ start:870 stop:2012 length:1143 start_codon:yes stop_codon:yes gene_type:complete